MKRINLNLNFQDGKAFPSVEFSTLWNIKKGNWSGKFNVLKPLGFNFSKENDTWHVVFDGENPPESIEVSDKMFGFFEDDLPAEKPTTFAGNKGAPYDSSDLNKFAPSGCLKLEVRGKNGDNYVIDSCLDVVEIIASYLPMKRESSTEKNERLNTNAKQLGEIISKNQDIDQFVLGKNKKNEFVLKVLNRKGLGL